MRQTRLARNETGSLTVVRSVHVVFSMCVGCDVCVRIVLCEEKLEHERKKERQRQSLLVLCCRGSTSFEVAAMCKHS